MTTGHTPDAPGTSETRPPSGQWSVHTSDPAARSFAYPEHVITRRATLAERRYMVGVINRVAGDAARDGNYGPVKTAWLRTRLVGIAVRTYLRPNAQVCFAMSAPTPGAAPKTTPKTTPPA